MVERYQSVMVTSITQAEVLIALVVAAHAGVLAVRLYEHLRRTSVKREAQANSRGAHSLLVPVSSLIASARFVLLLARHGALEHVHLERRIALRDLSRRRSGVHVDPELELRLELLAL